jgi:CBS-domain-containing membrane protein
MVTNFRTADFYEMLDTAFSRLQDCECHTLPVLKEEQLVGLVTMDNVGEFIRIQSTLKREGPTETGKTTLKGELT